MIIYTAIFDNYDKLPPHYWKEDNNVKFCCVSNFIKSKRKMNWDIIDADFNLDSTRKNRYVKINSHKFFPNEDITIYLDPTFMITDKFEHLVNKWLGDSDIAVRLHPSRNNIYEEAKFLMEEKPHKLENQSIVKEQIEMYKQDGYPESICLNEGGFIIRRNTEQVKKFNEFWWNIVKQYSSRDQLSFMYSIWKTKTKVTFIPREETDKYTTRVAWHI